MWVDASLRRLALAHPTTGRYNVAMSMARFKTVSMFLVAVLAAIIFWGFVIRMFAIHHTENAGVQALANLT